MHNPAEPDDLSDLLSQMAGAWFPSFRLRLFHWKIKWIHEEYLEHNRRIGHRQMDIPQVVAK
jgi:hypothetical protein